MSISSACSNVSVTINGTEMNLEDALDEVVRGLQKHLNKVQMQIRLLGVGSDRQDDFEEQIAEADLMENEIISMQELFNELRGISYQLVGEPETPQEKKWLKAHKAERKLFLQMKALEIKEQKKKTKDESKMSD
jgi:hypothetical protein